MNLVELVLLAYFAAAAMLASAGVALGVRAIAKHSRRTSQTALKDLLANDYYEAVSVVAPAYNTGDTVVASVRSMINLQHPQFEVIVVNDGSTDHTMDELIRHFDLVEVPTAHDENIATHPIHQMFRSTRHANLTVVDKEHGGRGDALNAALNIARRPLVCTTDVGSILDPLALVRASRTFMEDEDVVAVAGAVRPATGSVTRGGRVEVSPPNNWVGQMQANADVRTSVIHSATAGAGSLLTLSPFTVLRRNALNTIGGFLPSEDAGGTDLALRLHAAFRDTPKRIVFDPEPMCWTDSPDSPVALADVNARRARSLVRAVWNNRRMMLNPRYGRVGMLALPGIVLFSVLTPFIEVGTYAYIVTTAVTGTFNAPFAALILLLTTIYPAILSHVTVGAETLVGGCYAGARDRFMLAMSAFAEQCGPRQLSAVVRVFATVTPDRPLTTEPAAHVEHSQMDVAV